MMQVAKVVILSPDSMICSQIWDVWERKQKVSISDLRLLLSSSHCVLKRNFVLQNDTLEFRLDGTKIKGENEASC